MPEDPEEGLAPTLRGRDLPLDLSPAVAGAGEPPLAWWQALQGPIANALADLIHGAAPARLAAVAALARLGDRRAGEALAASLLDDPDGPVRAACPGALTRLFAGDLPIPLRRLVRRALADAQGPVRWAAAEALAATGDVHALPALEALLARELRAGGPTAIARVEAALAALRRRL